MVEAEVVRARIVGALDEIDQARQAMTRLHDIAPRLHDGVAPRFERTLTEQDDRLRRLKRDLADGRITSTAWPQLRVAREALGPVLRDIRVALDGAEARRDGLDRGLLDIADALLDELSVADEFRARMTVLADREFYPGDQVAEMIRLRFPDTSLWALPVVVHEFGHFLVRSLRIERPPGHAYPLAEILDGADQADRRILEELIADVFAAYAIGPAYGFTTVHLRFWPVPRGPFEAHPSGSARVEAILRTLEETGRADGGPGEYAGQVEVLRRAWAQLATDEPAPPSETEQRDRALVDQHLNRILAVLDASVPQVRYRTFRLAVEMAPMLRDGSWQQWQADRTIRDVMNAAWIVRLMERGNEVQINRVEQAALAAIARRRGLGGGSPGAGR